MTLKAACQRVVTQEMNFEAALIVDDEPFTLTARNGLVDIRYASAKSPDVVMTTSYDPMVAAGDGRMPMGDFMANHVKLVTHSKGKDTELMTLMAGAMTLIIDAT